jgi:uncharacterized protein (UPF0332 family)
MQPGAVPRLARDQADCLLANAAVVCRGHQHDHVRSRITGACCARPTLIEFPSSMDEAHDYLAKAQESLAGAESELAHRRLNNCARSAYYACFQAAIAALLNEQILPRSPEDLWGHDLVQARFAGQLIHRRSRHPATLRRTLTDLLGIRHKADYRVASVGQREAAQAVRRAQDFVREVQAHLL